MSLSSFRSSAAGAAAEATLSKASAEDIEAATDEDVAMRLQDTAYVDALPTASVDVLRALLIRLPPHVAAEVASTEGLLVRMSQEQVLKNRIFASILKQERLTPRSST